MASKPLVVNGKWFIPALFIGFVVFTVAMCWGTILLGSVMRPAAERRQIAAVHAEVEREREARQRAKAAANPSAQGTTAP